jgi:tetratricopeptide (TPR) repeat protein
VVHGRHAAAVTIYRNLVKQFPGVPQLWAELGIAATGDLEFTLASQSLRRATELAAKDSTLLLSIGEQYHRLRRLEKAIDCFQRAVAADPSSVHARLTLASMLERDRRLDKARACVEDCLAQNPQDGHVRYFRAFLLHRQGLNTEAETALRDLLRSDPKDANIKSSASHLLGTILDEFGQYPEAMRRLCEAKALVRQNADTATLLGGYDKRDAARRELLAALTPDTIKRWRDEAAAADRAHPLAFLGGSPRSGTTLIEQILGAHPEIVVFDEPKAFPLEVLGVLLPGLASKGLTLGALNAVPSAGRANFIRRYFKSLLSEAEEAPGGKLLLDKNPSTTASLHIWLRLFPHSKIIISLRDPRDVIISCFFQNLQLTALNANFLTLERTAKFYSDLTDVWLRMRDLGGFDWMETRYEDFVVNLEAGGRRVTEFLGLPWDIQQATYYETARRKFVFAPTYHDVTKPIYNRAVRRWEHYAEALEPCRAVLAPYCRAFGYSET